jgi:hypothetical protein
VQEQHREQRAGLGPAHGEPLPVPPNLERTKKPELDLCHFFTRARPETRTLDLAEGYRRGASADLQRDVSPPKHDHGIDGSPPFGVVICPLNRGEIR